MSRANQETDNRVLEFPSSTRIRDEAATWVARLDAGKLTAADLEALRAWSRRSRRHRDTLERVARVWDELGVLALYQGIVGPPPPVRRIPKLAGMAAVLAAIAVSAWFVLQLYETQPTFNGTYTTLAGEQSSIDLLDGSRVRLNTDSHLEIDYTDSTRRLQLWRGEAFFEVRSNPQRPFVVETDRGSVVALGTAFAVRVVPDQEMRVLVSEGQVQITAAVSSDAGKTGSQMPKAHASTEFSAGQRAVVDDTVQRVETLASDEVQRHLSWRQGVIMFAGDPLQDVVAEMNRYAPTRILIVDPALRELRFGGYFLAGNTDIVLNTLAAEFGVTVDRSRQDVVLLRSPD